MAITPYDPYHYHHHLVHRKEAHYEGDRVPEETSFYEEVAAALVSANEIVLVGHGTGKSSAVSVLEEYLNKHHIDLSRRVKATEIIDLSALTEPEIEAIAKRHMIAVITKNVAAGQLSNNVGLARAVVSCYRLSQRPHPRNTSPSPREVHNLR